MQVVALYIVERQGALEFGRGSVSFFCYFLWSWLTRFTQKQKWANLRLPILFMPKAGTYTICPLKFYAPMELPAACAYKRRLTQPDT